MLTRLKTFSLLGATARPVDVEVSLTPLSNETRLDFGVGDFGAAPREEKKSAIWTPGDDDARGGSGTGKLWTPD